MLLLDPLLTYREDSGVFFFYNDLKEKCVSLLNYDECLHLRDEALRTYFLSRFPIHEWKSPTPEAQDFLPRIEALTEVFKGRRSDLRAIFEFLKAHSGFLMVWGAPGVGKSALLARVIQVLAWPVELLSEVYPELPHIEHRFTVVPYFIRRDEGTDGADRLLDNLNRRIEARFRTGIPLGGSVPIQADALKNRLEAVSRQLGDADRLLLVIDGLDEGSEAESLLENLPRVVPDNIVLLYASRENPRVVEVVYEHLDRERRDSMVLDGLLVDDVRALLHEFVDKYALQQEYIDAVLESSGGNPLYLKLLCEGLAVGDYRLNDRVLLPKRMEEIFDQIYRRLAKIDGVPDFLAVLVAAKNYLSTPVAASILSCSESGVRTRMIHGCREVLHENPLTEDIEDYQLFHESLREYLQSKYMSDVVRWDEHLADWCLGWAEFKSELRRFAVANAIPHLLSSYRRHMDDRHRAADGERLAAERYNQMLALVDDAEFRKAVFQTCGNSAPLQNALLSVQRLIVERGNATSDLSRIVRYALAFHEENLHQYREQLERLDQSGESGRSEDLQELAELALMGEDPRERVMLVIRALWKRQRTPRLPEVLTRRVHGWLEEASDAALSELWEQTLNR